MGCAGLSNWRPRSAEAEAREVHSFLVSAYSTTIFTLKNFWQSFFFYRSNPMLYVLQLNNLKILVERLATRAENSQETKKVCIMQLNKIIANN